MRHLLFLALMVTLAAAQTAPFRDDFDTVEGWAGNNDRAPAEIRGDGGLLILTDPPGGEVTWGTSIARDIGPVDLDATPWLVAHVPAMTGTFQAKLVNLDTKEKSDGFATLREPGYAVAHVRTITGWSGTVNLSLWLYVQGTEKSVSVDWVKFAGKLAPEEQAVAPVEWPQPQPHHGLTALADRRAWRPLERFREGDGYLSERVIYRDTATGNTVWRMTVDPGVDKVAYYDLPEWNADGSRLMFETRRAWQRLWSMAADGTDIRPLFPDIPTEQRLRNGYWSVIQPDIWFSADADATGTQVVAYNVSTGEETVVASTARPNLQLMPPHPREDRFLLARQTRDMDECEVVVLDRDGGETVVPIGGRFHRLRFTKRDDGLIFYNRDDPRTQWVIMPDGSGRRELPDPGSHPDWTWDGAELTYFADGGVYAVKPDGSPRRELFTTGSGGHGGPSRDGRWYVADQYASGDYPYTILFAPTDGSGTVHRLAHHGSVLMSHTEASNAHPDHHSTHPHPSLSPDGTKAVFSSYSDRAYTDVQVAVTRYPDPPRNLRANPRGDQVVFTWDAPENARELAGYAVYASDSSGEGFTPLHDGLLTEREFVLDGLANRLWLTVVAVEHSGLASRPTEDIPAMPWDRIGLPFHRYVEAEEGTLEAPARLWLDHSAHSNGWAAGLGAAGTAKLAVPVDVPRTGEVTLWLRIKGEGSVTISHGFAAEPFEALPSTVNAPPGWHWVRVGTRLMSGTSQEVSLSWQAPELRIDKLLLTDDPDYVPSGARRLNTLALPDAAPGKLEATALDAHHVELTWEPPAARGIDHFNVYAVPAPDGDGSQATLLASTGDVRFVDWGREPGSTVHYRVTSVDRFGNESPESIAAGATLPGKQTVTLDLSPADAQLGEGVALVDGALTAPNGGTATWSVDLPAAGEYAVWSQHGVPDRNSRNAALRWDDGGAERWVMHGPFGQPSWWAVQGPQTTTPTLFQRPAGPQTLSLDLPKGETRLLGLRVTNDARLMPAEFGAEPMAPESEEAPMDAMIPRGEVLYEDDFTSLEPWHHEGIGELTLPEPGTMKLQVLGSRQGGEGCMAFLRRDFPDHIALEYDLKVLSPNGLVITFVAMEGLNGEDMLDIPGRTGIFADYVGKDARLKSYHVSVSRYNDKAEHTGVSNWRRNPGLHLMAQGPDLCREINRWYRIRIVKDGRRVQLQVNGEVAHGFVDPDELPIPLPTDGKIGFRAIGSDVRCLIRNLRVVAME